MAKTRTNNHGYGLNSDLVKGSDYELFARFMDKKIDVRVYTCTKWIILTKNILVNHKKYKSLSHNCVIISNLLMNWINIAKEISINMYIVAIEQIIKIFNIYQIKKNCFIKEDLLL